MNDVMIEDLMKRYPVKRRTYGPTEAVAGVSLPAPAGMVLAELVHQAKTVQA